jgi:hypothetical protein
LPDDTAMLAPAPLAIPTGKRSERGADRKADVGRVPKTSRFLPGGDEVNRHKAWKPLARLASGWPVVSEARPSLAFRQAGTPHKELSGWLAGLLPT